MCRKVSGVLLMMLIATTAFAQTGKHVALGGGIGFSKYVDDDFESTNPHFAPLYRLDLKTDSGDGWKWSPKGSVGYSNREVRGVIGGESTTLGRLQLIPVTAGIQRSLRQGPWKFSMGIGAGLSINHMNVESRARDFYQTQGGSTLEDIQVKNSLVVKPEIGAWYDVGKWFGVHGSLSYTVNRPKAETTVNGATTSSTWKTDHASAVVGLAVGIF